MVVVRGAALSWGSMSGYPYNWRHLLAVAGGWLAVVTPLVIVTIVTEDCNQPHRQLSHCSTASPAKNSAVDDPSVSQLVFTITEKGFLLVERAFHI